MRDFLKHLADPSPGFRCSRAGDPTEALLFNVRVRHRLNPAASAEDLCALRRLLGEGCGEVEQLYAVHDGLNLYCQGDSPAIQFYAIRTWGERQGDWKSWYEGMDDGELYDFQRHGVAFGEVSFSGNCFVLYQGKVLYANHDGGDDTPLADTFFGFLSLFCEDPAKFLYRLGCYTRYEDGKTDAQWIPERYIADMK